MTSFPNYIFSPKELKDFNRRVKVAKLLKNKKTWKEIRQKTGAHLQTISLVSKRLKGGKEIKTGRNPFNRNHARARRRTIFVFGQPE